MSWADRVMFVVWILLGLVILAELLQTARGASLEVQIAPRFGNASGQFDRAAFTNAAGETLSVTRADLLVSDFALRRADGAWLGKSNEVAFLHLAAEHTSFRVAGIPAGHYDQLRFRVGVPTELNHSDAAKYPADHPLNPNFNGLHWSWQGGYIFMALEGRWSAPGTESPSGYSLHLANDWNLTTVTLPVALELFRDVWLQLDFDLAGLLHSMSFAKDGTSTHSREGDPLAGTLAANLPKAFRVSRDGAGVPGSLSESRDPGSPGRLPRQSVKPLYMPAKFTPHPFTMSSVFPVPDLPRDNPLIEERVTLGRVLFHETRLSRDNSISCASCHNERAAFSDPRRFSVGVEGRPGKRQAMPLFNLAWRNSFFWDGRAPSLRAQALAPIQDHDEMDETLERVVTKLRSSRRMGAPSNHHGEVSLLTSVPTNSTDYPTLFTAAFGSPEITPEKIGLAIESFVLTLASFDSKFDRAMRGEAVKLTDEEQRGFALFFTEYDPRRGQFGADCFHCHGGANFSNHGFANNGLDSTFTDPGRFAVTQRESDRGKFAVPSLRNIALTAPYMHDGRFATLEEVVAHYSTGMRRSATLDPNFAKHPAGGVQLSGRDQRALVAFLETLTEERWKPQAAIITQAK